MRVTKRRYTCLMNCKCELISDNIIRYLHFNPVKPGTIQTLSALVNVTVSIIISRVFLLLAKNSHEKLNRILAKKVQRQNKFFASLEKTAKLVNQTLLNLCQCMYNLINVIKATLKDSSMPNTTRQPSTPAERL